MNRRSFLGNLLAGAAAIVGVGMVAPKAEAAEITPISETPEQMAEALAGTGYFDGRLIVGSRVSLQGATIQAPNGVGVAPLARDVALIGNYINTSPSTVTWNGAGYMSQLGPGTYQMPARMDLRGMSNLTIRGAGIDQTIITHAPSAIVRETNA